VTSGSAAPIRIGIFTGLNGSPTERIRFDSAGAVTVYTGPFLVPDGSASAPSLGFKDDTNTGLYRIAADTVGVATGGAERVRVDSSGRVGIGRTPTAVALEVAGTVRTDSVLAVGAATLIPSVGQAIVAYDTGNDYSVIASYLADGSGGFSAYKRLVVDAGTVEFTHAIATYATSPAALSADQNDYSPGAFGLLRLSATTTTRNVTGMVAGRNGERRTLVNVGSISIVLKHQSASSSAANRFLCTTGADVTLAADGWVEAVYDATTQRWRVKP
jgi:hypothetical protein